MLAVLINSLFIASRCIILVSLVTMVMFVARAVFVMLVITVFSVFIGNFFSRIKL